MLPFARATFLALVVGLGVAPAARAYERELGSRNIREAVFMAKDDTFRSTDFLKDYVHTFPTPEQGVYVQSITIATPFKQVVDRARGAAGEYSPVTAEADYQRDAPLPVLVRVHVELTPTFPAHTPYTVPVFVGSVQFRDPDFWKLFTLRLVQRGELQPRLVRGQPVYSCGDFGPCWLSGADITAEFDASEVASRPARVTVLTPDGQRIETEFELDRLR